MSRVRVKICGITSIRDLLTSVKAGADAVGFVVNAHRSSRNLPLDKANILMEATPIFVETVAVTVPEDLRGLVKINDELNPDVIQIHGLISAHQDVRDWLPDVCLIRAFQVKQGLTVNAVLKIVDAFDAILLDSYNPGGYGGTGETHNWNLSRRIRDAVYPKPLILAGGLKPENVREAICMVKPYAVDVSSGVESRPGTKDSKKIFEFIRNAREVEI
jgi:phosphoribosylanthranilate isomerase